MFKNDGVKVQEYVYDVAVDGGGTGAKTLSSKAGAQPLPVGAIVKAVHAKVVTAFTSGGSATLEWGNSADADGYSGVAKAVASLTANSVFNGLEDATNPAALTWNNTDDHPVPYAVVAANSQDFKVNVGTAAMTAGKAVFMVEFYYPSLP